MDGWLVDSSRIVSKLYKECWSIIKERTFGNASPSPELEAIGRDIAHKCGGFLQQWNGSSQPAFDDIGNEFFNDLY
ncbi:hypothetical protein V6N12_018019 [Hibiscus sabdariffa]|uniref:Uncharacterized protein n=1 Tax=Hibiscus sabdariffa TaxID=183260 RepID=A0ABR2AA03_9ROSI